ncbi:MAG: AMP-dependent synthetase, partial [Alphaproteobacteria bacterium HGW-Alphaproteobacteria-10]
LIADGLLSRVFAPIAADSKYLKALIVAGKPLSPLDTGPTTMSFDEAVASGDTHAPPPRTCIDIDLAAIIYTSGSTGDPKGVMLTHRNMITAATSVSTYLRMAEDDVVLCVLPLSFDYGLYQMLMSYRLGARLVVERSFTFPAQVLKVVVDEQVTSFPGVPTIFAILGELKNLADYDFSRIRFVTNTAAALPVKHIDLLRKIFPKARVYSMYGLTECKRCTYLPPEDIERKPTSVGIAIPNTEMWIVNEKDERVGPNEVGQLVIRGATVMRGYWEKPEQTAKKLKPGPLPGELVLYTGDYCKMDEEGYLYFVGRMDDVIKSRGEKVAPKEVENAIVHIPGVKEVAVI